MSFYKMQSGQNEFYFQLANLEPAREEYIFWKEGALLPIREAINGVSPRDAYWLPKDKWFDPNQQFEGIRADRSFQREIIINQGGVNSQYTFSFKKRDNDQLNVEISNITNLQRKDPLAFSFKFRKTGQGTSTVRVVVAMQEVGIPKDVVLTNTFKSPLNAQISTKASESVQPPLQETSLKSPGFAFNVKPADELKLDDFEKEILEAALIFPEKLTEERFAEGWNETMRKEKGQVCSIERTRQIYKKFYVGK